MDGNLRNVKCLGVCRLNRIFFAALALVVSACSVNQHMSISKETVSMKKKFKLESVEIERMVPDIGSSFATDMITVDGKKVDYMVRHEAEREGDSGWLFYGGGESQEYIDDPNNTSIFSVNTIANYDPDIIGFLTYPPGTEIERNSNGELQVIDPKINKPEVIFFYPVDEGTVQIINNWSFNVSTRMLRRYDKGSLVIWRPGLTIWLETYSSNDISIKSRVEKILRPASPERYDLKEVHQDEMSKIRYRLDECIEGKKQSSAYIFGFTDTQEINISIYFDDQESIVEVDKIWNTLLSKDA